MFKAILLSELYNLSDDQVAYPLRDRLSFVRFLGLGLEDTVPDAKTVWLYREQLAQAGAVEQILADFDRYLRDQGYVAKGGQIMDASMVPVPRQHNTKDENKQIKAGEVPGDWADKPAKTRQKETDARWTKKNGKSHDGDKNPINADRRYTRVRLYDVTDASVHDSQTVDAILDDNHTAKGVWADSAYRSASIEAKLKEKGLKSHIHRKAQRGKPLGAHEKRGNTTRSRVRVRVEHIFGSQTNDLGGTLIRSVGMLRAKARVGLKNLTDNIRRFTYLDGLRAAPT